MFDLQRRRFITLLGGAARSVAARGKGAAASDAGDRVSPPFIARSRREPSAAEL